MGKKYLNTKKGSIEQSILDVWQEAAASRETPDQKTANFVKAAKRRKIEADAARGKFESNRVKRENKKNSVKTEQPETQHGSGEHAYEVGTDRYAEYTAKITPGQIQEEIAELNALIEELEEGILGNIAKAAGKSVVKGAGVVAKKAYGAVKKKASGSMIGKAVGKVKTGAKKVAAVGKKIKKAVRTGKAYGDEYAPMLEELEIIESKLNEYSKILEEVDLDESKMSQLHQYIKDKKSAAEIARLMKVDVKTIKSLMGDFKEEEVREENMTENRNLTDTIKNLWIEAAAAAVDPKEREELDLAPEDTAKKMKRAKEPAPGVSEEVELDEATGKEIAAKMMKDTSMKAFASKVAKMKTVSRDDLEKLLPDYVAGGAITKLFEEDELGEGTKEEYQKFFQGALKKFKIKSPAELKSDEEKKKFFDYVDKNYTGEKDEEKIELAKEFKVSSMRHALEKVWSVAEGELPPALKKAIDAKKKDKEEDEDYHDDDEKKGNTMTGKKKAAVDVNPQQGSR